MLRKGKPNILIIGNLDSHPSAEAFLNKFLKIIKSLSNEMCIISGDKPIYEDILWIEYEGYIKSTSLSNRIINFVRSQLWLLKTILNLNFSYDIVLMLPTSFLLPNILLKLKGKSVGLFVAQRPSKFFILLSKINFIFSDLLVVESESVTMDWNMGRYDKKILKGNMYVDKNLFHKVTEINDRKVIIGYIGRLTVDKGVLNFIKSIPLILKEESNVEFLIVGEGQLQNTINKMLTEMNLEEHVKLEGWVEHNSLSHLLNKLKLLILPSYTEGLPNIVLEAMASGTPVLASAIGGIPTLVKNNKNGFILEDNSPSCIANHVINILQHYNLEEISKNALRTIEEDYSHEKSFNNWVNIIKFLQ